MGANKVRDLDVKYFCETANNGQPHQPELTMPPGLTKETNYRSTYILNDRSSANVDDDVGVGDDQPRPPPH